MTSSSLKSSSEVSGFSFAGVFLHHVDGKVGLVADFADPLAGCRDVRRKDERLGLDEGHGRKSDDGLTRTAGQHDDARAALFGTARVEYLCRFPLVVAECELLAGERRLAQVDGQRVAHGVAREVFDGESGVREYHLQVTAAFRVHDGVQVVLKFQNERLDILELADFREHVLVVGFHDQEVAILLEAQQAVAGHVVLDFGDDRLRDGVTALAFQAFQHFGSAQAGCCRVPEAQVRYLVCMQVLGALYQFGEGGDCVASCFVGGGIDLDHDFEVALYNDCAVRIHRAPNIVKMSAVG